MKNIQAQYQDLLEGKMSMSNFMRSVRMQFPQHISPTTSYDDSVKILKGKRILSEAKKPEGVYGHNPNAENDTYRGIDHLNYYQVYHGIQYELAKMPEITDENYVKARKKVVDTILKDPDAYKQLQLANFKAVKEMDKDLEMKDVKKNNLNDKPNEMKVVKKDAKENTQSTLEKKEKKKAKNGKGLDHMTQTPKGKLEAFATPGKEKVHALKEHILDEMTTQNPHHEDFHKGMEVYKKKGDGVPGKVIEFDGHTATVEWQDGRKEDLQKNVLTKVKPEKAEVPMPDKPRTMVQWSNNEEKLNEDPVGQQAAGDEEEEASLRATVIKKEDRGSMLKKLKERLVKAIKKEGIRKNPNNQTFVATNTPADDSLANQMGYTQPVPGSLQFLGKKKGG
jgi:hypothetical protein